MTLHIIDSDLHDYVDAELTDAQRATVERHLASCAECRGRVHDIERLRERLRALPRSIEPEQDLLPGIRARVRPAVVAIEGHMPARANVRTRWPLLAAAAIALVLVSSFVTMLVVRGTAPQQLAREEVTDNAAQLVDLRATEAHYVDAIDELRRALLRDQGVLEPATVRLLEQSLNTIDVALQEARQALAADPGNAVLAEMLHANYEKKLDLLRRASAHARVRL